MKIRRYVGTASIYLDSEPLLESSMNAVEVKPDTVALVVELLAGLDAIMAKVISVACLNAVEVGNIKMDAVRASVFIRSQGRILAGQLAKVFGLNGPISDCFSALPTDGMDMPNQRSGRRAE